MLEDAINRVEIEATGRRLATGPSPRAPVQPGNSRHTNATSSSP
jgi:hypothetical protein